MRAAHGQCPGFSDLNLYGHSMVPAAFSVAGTCVLIGFGYSGAVPAVPGQLPVVPGRLSVVPGRLSVVPGRLSVVLVRLLLSRPIPVVLRSFGYPVRFRIFPGWNRSCLPSQFAEKEPNVCAVPYFFIYLRVSFRAGGDLPIFVRL